MELEDYLKPFKAYNEAFGKPCLVHATNKVAFLKALSCKKLMTSKGAESGQLLGKMESVVGLHDCVWFSVGFNYNSCPRYKINFGFIFSPKVLDKDFMIFKVHIMDIIHKEIIRYWQRNSPEFLAGFLSKNKKVNRMISAFLDNEKKGDVTVEFPWWEIKEESYQMYCNYKNKRELRDYLKKIVNHNQVKKFREKFVNDTYLNSLISQGETISFRDVKLNKDLIGFFVRKNHFGEVKRELEQYLKLHPNLVIFDSEKITNPFP